MAKAALGNRSSSARVAARQHDSRRKFQRDRRQFLERAASRAVDKIPQHGTVKDMTPTITQMEASEQPPMYSLIVRTFKKGLAGVPVFTDFKKVPITYSRERVEDEAIVELADPTTQVRVEADGLIVAVGLYGSLLWLTKVPPPKYWLDYRNRPAPRSERLAACGLPIPERYREPGVSCP